MAWVRPRSTAAQHLKSMVAAPPLAAPGRRPPLCRRRSRPAGGRGSESRASPEATVCLMSTTSASVLPGTSERYLAPRNFGNLGVPPAEVGPGAAGAGDVVAGGQRRRGSRGRRSRSGRPVRSGELHVRRSGSQLSQGSSPSALCRLSESVCGAVSPAWALSCSR